ncbi:hypothetical protein PVL29_004046 [Vitis rotundifolia]|uniref:Uncharacterized protein n=1 Tax=Vitis rotundifolia TaxID=103349 RepID=A0AA39A948_VITRO|nr:hypothetical protein PVL29_004046 [Vitis rotundifolia]
MADQGLHGGEKKRGFGDGGRSRNDENGGGFYFDIQDLSAKRARVFGLGDGVEEGEGVENLGGGGEGIEERELGIGAMVVDKDLDGNKEWGLDLNIFPTGTSAIDTFFRHETRLGKGIAEEREELPGSNWVEIEEGVGFRYTREQKGKGKAVDHPMLNANRQKEKERWFGNGVSIERTENEGGKNDIGGVVAEDFIMMPPEQMGLDSEAHKVMVSCISELQDFNQSRENTEPTDTLMAWRQRALFVAIANAAKRRENAVRYRQIARRSGPQLAHFDPEEAERYAVYISKKAQKPSVNKKAEDFEGPFYEAMEMINKRKLVAEKNSTPLIGWVPSTQGHTITKRLVPSLVDVSLDALAKNSDAIVSLELIPDVLRHKISRAICRGRRMNAHFMELLLRGSPTEIRVDDCSWMTEEQFTNLFRRCKTKNLTVIQLDLCGRCMTLSTLLGTIARSSNCLPALATMSLRGACRLLNEGIGVLVTSARTLQSLNLGQCSLLTHYAINFVADVLGHTLKELFIDDCQNINAMLALPALKQLECLEVLSVAGIQTVCDDFISEIVTALGSNMKELVLANCFKITDDSLEAIGRTCSSLSAIDLSNLDLLTDSALHYLANGCRSIQTLRLCRNNFRFLLNNIYFLVFSFINA